MAQEVSPPTYRAPPCAKPRGVPRFLLSLYEIVDDEKIDDLIRWSPGGDSFFVLEPDRLAREHLVKWFKTKNYSSFVRQLHYYGFFKTGHLQQGALRPSSAVEYDHYKHTDSKFRRNRRDLLSCIRRKGQAAPTHSVQFTEVGDPSQPIPVPIMLAAGDDSREQLLEEILLDVGTLKRRQTELDTENRSLRDTLETMGRQVEFLWRLLASLGFLPVADHCEVLKDNNQLMIRGVPGEVVAGEATYLDKSIDSRWLGDFHDTSLSPALLHSILPQNSVGGPSESSSHSEFDRSYHIPLSRGDPTDSCLHLPAEVDSYNFDAHNSQFINPPVETLNGFNQNNCVGENDVGSFHHIHSSFAGSSTGAVTSSDMPTTSDIPGAFSQPITPADPTTNVTKRKARVMDELEWGPSALQPIHHPCFPLFHHNIYPAAEITRPKSLLPHDQNLAPNNCLTLDPTPCGFENESRPFKRVKYTTEENF